MNQSTIKLAALVALVIALAPSLLFFFGVLNLAPMKWIMLAGTIAWFGFATPWLAKRD